MRALRSINEGILSPDLAVEQMVESMGKGKAEAIEFYEEVTRRQRQFTEDAKKSTDALNSMVDVIKKMSTIRSDIAKSMVDSTPSSELAIQQKQLLKTLEKGSKVQDSNKFLALKESGIFGDSNEELIVLSGALDDKIAVLQGVYGKLDKSLGKLNVSRDYEALARNALSSTGDADALNILNNRIKAQIERLEEINRSTDISPELKDIEKA
jgi:hypothetical protein